HQGLLLGRQLDRGGAALGALLPVLGELDVAVGNNHGPVNVARGGEAAALGVGLELAGRGGAVGGRGGLAGGLGRRVAGLLLGQLVGLAAGLFGSAVLQEVANLGLLLADLLGVGPAAFVTGPACRGLGLLLVQGDHGGGRIVGVGLSGADA